MIMKQKYLFFSIITLSLLLIASPLFSSSTHAEENTAYVPATAQQYAPNEVVVKWKEFGAGVTQLQSSRNTLSGIRAYRTLSLDDDIPDRRLSVVRSPHFSAEELVEQFSKLPNVEYAHPNYYFRAQAQTTPWGVNNTNGVKARTVHTSDSITGDGVIVAVIDSGVDIDHPDLDGNLWSPVGDNCTANGNSTTCPNGGYDFVNEDNNPQDDNGHGTHVAGTVAAEDNSIGVVGVAPGAEIMAVKALSAEGYGEYADLIQSIDFARINGADVINMSLGVMSLGYITKDFQDAIDDAVNADVAVVVAAGNNATNGLFIPAAFDNVITVGAIQQTSTANNPDGNYNTRLAYFSNFGKIDVVAPGVDINSTTYDGSYSGASWDGTSMAAPHVAGVAALVIEKRADLGESALEPAELQHILETTATDLGETGRDEFFGSGLVNASTAVDAAVDSSTKTVLIDSNWSTNSSSNCAFIYYCDPTVRSTFLPSDGSTSTTLRIRVATEDGTPVASQSVNLATTGGSLGSSSVTTNSSGIATTTLTASSTAGNVTITATIPSTAITDSMVAQFADTLIVTDDGKPLTPGVAGWYFWNALETNGVNWKMSPENYPSQETTLSSYDTVVWHTEQYNLNTTEQENIQDYLDGGGNVLISGGDILYTYNYYKNLPDDASSAEELNWNTYGQDVIFNDYLKLGYEYYVATNLNIVGDDNFDETGGTLRDFGDNSDNAPYSDVASVVSGGTLEGYYCSNSAPAIVSVDSTYKSVFVAAALEYIGKTDRQEIVENAMDFLTGNAQSGGSFDVPSACDSSTTSNDGSVDDPNFDELDDSDAPTPGTPDDTTPTISDDVITNLTVSEITGTTATLTWETDVDISSSLIYATNTETDEVEVTTAGDTTEATIEDLTGNTTYEFAVYGVYSDDTYTSATTITNTTAPGAPNKPTLKSKAQKNIQVSLSDPADTGFQFRVTISNTQEEVLATSTLEGGVKSVKFTGLKPGKTYKMRTRLVYADEDEETVLGDFSPYLTATTHTDRVKKPAVLQITADSAKIRWKKPKKGKVKKYIVQVREKQQGKFVKVQKLTVKKKLKKSKKRKKVESLTPGTQYRVKVRAIFKNKRKGRWSKNKKFKTKKS